MTIFWIGDLAHQGSVSGHNPDDYPPLRAELTDSDTDPEVRALDFMIGPRFGIEDGWNLVNALTGGVDRYRVYYMIYRSTIWRRATGFQPESYGGQNHNDHVHVSGYVTDDENGSDWQSVLALGMEVEMADVYYKIQSTDGDWNGRVYVSNRIHSRRLRNPGGVQTPAKAGATEILLTDAMRESVSASETWERYILSVAGPVFPELVCNCNCNESMGDHTHGLIGNTGPAQPSP
jgi:hypothetical protein